MPHLHLAISDDHGHTFSWVATLDRRSSTTACTTPPLEVNELLVFYTKFYVGKCLVPPGFENTYCIPPKWPKFVRKPGSIFKEPTGPCRAWDTRIRVRLAFVDLKQMKLERCLR